MQEANGKLSRSATAALLHKVPREDKGRGMEGLLLFNHQFKSDSL